MQVDVKKFIFLGHKNDKTSFFQEAQRFGCIHFSRKDAENEDITLYSEALSSIKGEGSASGDPKMIAQEILGLRDGLRKAAEDIAFINKEIQRIAPFGDFSFEDIAYLKDKLELKFYMAKKGTVENPDFIQINTCNGFDYFLAPSADAIEMIIDRPMSFLKEALIDLEVKKKQSELVLHDYGKYKTLLLNALEKAFDYRELKKAENGSASDSYLFTATGFIPVDKIATIKTAFPSILIEEISFENEAAPTCLVNDNLGKIGEDLVDIYETPSSTDKDPSLWIFFSFILFFSMIVGDGGYGSIYLGLSFYLRYKFPYLEGGKKRILDLSTYLSAGCVVWGILTNAFFGLQWGIFRPFSIIAFLASKKAGYLGLDIGHAEIFNTLSDQVLFELSLVFGGVHLLIGLFRYLKKRFCNLGWIIFLCGSFLYFPVYLKVPSFLHYVVHVPYETGGTVGLVFIFSGIALAISAAVYKNGLLGLAEAMNLIQVFGDTLSYLRLYALGLSGSILSATINHLAGHLPFIIAIFLIIAGHLINMVLGLMGGVIHGLRLNFIEWYHYSFDGGGRKFNPLKKIGVNHGP